MRKKIKTKPTFTVGFAVRLWVEREVTGENIETVLSEARKTAVADLVDMNDGVSVNDSNITVVQVYDQNALDMVVD